MVSCFKKRSKEISYEFNESFLWKKAPKFQAVDVIVNQLSEGPFTKQYCK